jgi:hypothetical protein
MKYLVVILAVVTAACEKPTAPTPVTPVQPTVVATVAESCQPFSVDWKIDLDLSGAILRVHYVRPVEVFELEELDNKGWRFLASGGWLRPGEATLVQARFEMQYRIRGRIGTCWSTWDEFIIGPPNPTGNGDPAPWTPPAPTKPPCKPRPPRVDGLGWTWCK